MYQRQDRRQAGADEAGRAMTLVSSDPSAYWDSATNTVAGGCMAAGTCLQHQSAPDRDQSAHCPDRALRPSCLLALRRIQRQRRHGARRQPAGVLHPRGCAMRSTRRPPAWCGAHPNQVVVGIAHELSRPGRRRERARGTRHLSENYSPGAMSPSSTVADDQPRFRDDAYLGAALLRLGRIARAHLGGVGCSRLHPAARDGDRPRSLGPPAFRPRLVAHRNPAVRRSLLLHAGSAMGQSRVAQRGRHGGRLSDRRDDWAGRAQGRDPR